MTNRMIAPILAARLLVMPVTIVGVLAYGPGLTSAVRALQCTLQPPGKVIVNSKSVVDGLCKIDVKETDERGRQLDRRLDRGQRLALKCAAPTQHANKDADL